MKAALYYAFRQIQRRPRDFLAVLTTSAVVLLAMFLMLLGLETQWRQSVMPDHEANFHFTLYDLTEEEMEEVAGWFGVQAVYVEEEPGKVWPKSYNIQPKTALRVRISMDQAPRTQAIYKDMLDTFELWERPPYEQYNSVEGKQIVQHMRIGINRSFLVDTATPYLMRPATLLMMELFALFLGSAIAILLYERYQRNMPEFGTLRALGFTKGQIAAMNIAQSGLISLLSLPLAVGMALGITTLFKALTADLPGDKSMIALLDYIPAAGICVAFLTLFVTTLAGSALVCVLLRNVELLDQLRGQTNLQVSFVAKTSERLAQAKTMYFYTILHFFRTRRSSLLYTLAILVMLPLPIVYGELFGAMGSIPENNAILMSRFYLVQAAMLLLTTIGVCIASSAYQMMGRRRELATFRALGCSRWQTLRLVLPEILLQSLLASLICGVVINDLMLRFAFAEVSRPAMEVLVFMGGIFQYIGISFLASFPFLLLGTFASLHRITSANIIDHLRGVE